MYGQSSNEPLESDVTTQAKSNLMNEAHKQARLEMNEYARRQGFTYAQTFRSVLSGLWAARNGFTGAL